MSTFLSFGHDARRIAEADSVAVIGLGRFGTSLALELMASGTEVLGIDGDEDIVQALNGELTQVVRADSTKLEVLQQLAIGDFDRVVVAIGSDITASILTASLLLQLQVPVIWAKAVDERHGAVLEQLGVHRVIYPEKDMGRRVAHLVRGAAADYLEIDKGFAIVKTTAPRSLHGVTLADAAVRASHGVTVAAHRSEEGSWTNASPETVLGAGDTVLVVGPIAKVERFAQLR
ncbi:MULTISPECIES: potassium channel family protein [Microbacterium]|uniref:potassium channel family protein n=1 Tax=Microbacterium TaxID=33882 RepID=UPI00217ECAF2|nr:MULTISPECIES: TrkA family potassium uptake protein [Microbacterium]UWF77656.1 TrkA family potassium uptake protein [Microbacterium neungamense]WCM55825.1 TrkA family potassium uptake protein [Microbacterium sp. EF45047]